MKMILAVMMATLTAVGLAGCSSIAIDSKQPTENSVAPADLLAYRYVRSHDCKADYRSQPWNPRFNYSTGTVEERPQYTNYQCKNPDVRVLVDDAPK